eukprot:3727573-Amphidinium_carterae.1
MKSGSGSRRLPVIDAQWQTLRSPYHTAHTHLRPHSKDTATDTDSPMRNNNRSSNDDDKRQTTNNKQQTTNDKQQTTNNKPQQQQTTTAFPLSQLQCPNPQGLCNFLT